MKLTPYKSDLPSEKWIDIKGFEGAYMVSSLGRIRSIRRVIKFKNGSLNIRGGYIISSKPSATCPYARVRLSNTSGEFVHRIVAAAFVENKNPGFTTDVHHKNSIKSDNRADNLEWVTPQFNSLHSKRVMGIGSGENHHNAKLTVNQVREIRKKFSNGEMIKSLSAFYGVSVGAISRITNGTGWIAA